MNHVEKDVVRPMGCNAQQYLICVPVKNERTSNCGGHGSLNKVFSI